MTTSSVRTQQLKRIVEIRRLARRDARLVRCDGSQAELERYRAGSADPGWTLARRSRQGDLLLSCVGRGDTRLIVSLCLVVKMDGPSAIWEDETDVPVTPPVLWADVMRGARLPTRARKTFEGAEREAVLDSLATCLQRVSTLSSEEGEERLTRCRERSAPNRARKLAASDGSCEACGANLGVLFPDRGDRALEVHHRTPLAKRAPGRVKTSLDGLTVLCATCHKLIHADPHLDLERLRVQWLMQA